MRASSNMLRTTSSSYTLPHLLTRHSPSTLKTLHRLSSSSSPHYPSNPSKTHLPISPHLRPLFRFGSVMSVGIMGRGSVLGRASLSTGSNSGARREILVQHLLLKEDDTNLLAEIQKKIARGKDLGDLAVEYSICPSKEEGGMLGWVRKGQMVPEFEEAAFGAKLNEVVKCKTQFGWHLLQVLSEREELLLREIQPEELHMKLQDPSFVEEAQLIDVREPEEVALASLAGFEVLPLRQFGNWAPEMTTKFDLAKETYVLGFKKVFNVTGGIHAYAVKADPSIPTY
ncbi:Rhodanese-like/PpiC domain-containing protein [Drosera capensis]